MKLYKQIASGIVFLILFVLPGTLLFAQQPPRRPGKPLIKKGSSESFVPGELLVKFRDNVSEDSIRSFSAKNGARHIRKATKHLALIKLDSGVSLESARDNFSADPQVEWVQPNYIYHISGIPDDASFGEQWGLYNTGQTVSDPSYYVDHGTAGMDMDLVSTWDYATDCSSVPVAVIDSGINYNQEDLAGNLWDGSSCVDEGGSSIAGGCPHGGYDFVDDDTDPMDLNGHGSHVAGIIGASGNNGIGVTGVCRHSSLMAIRVMDTGGSGTTADIVSGLQFAIQNGAKVVNMSLGGSTYDTAFHDAISDAQAADVVVVVAAGNDGLDNSFHDTYPCNYSQENLICVAALDPNYALASFSNYGVDDVDVGAPGANIHSTWNGLQTRLFNGTTDGFWDWTKNGSWTTGNCSWDSYRVYLVNPGGWCDWSTVYAASDTSTAYRVYSLPTGYTTYTIDFVAGWDMENGYDSVYFDYETGSSSPFVDSNYTDTFTGDTGAYMYLQQYELTKCSSGGDCSVGVKINSDSTVNKKGFGMKAPTITGIDVGETTHYKTIDGTSMAAPHVAGLAALIRAYNPSYNTSQTVESIQNGGEKINSLKNKTTTERAANAYGSLKYITEPKNITLTPL